MGRLILTLFQKPIKTVSPNASKITRISQHCSQSSAALTWNCSGAERSTFSLKGGGHNGNNSHVSDRLRLPACGGPHILEKAKQDYAVYNSKKAWIPSEKEKLDILDLAQKIPKIWNAPTSTPKEKKRIIRILIDDITVLAEKRCPDFSIGIRFRSGKREQLSLKKNLPYGDRRKHTESTVSRIRELAATMDDFEIADQLNQDGLTTTEGKAFTYAGIRWIRYKHDISGPYQRNRTGISVAEAATLLGISTGKVYYSISAGKIPARKQHQGWPWEILIDDSNLESIKALYT